jgi:hypothetical protein
MFRSLLAPWQSHEHLAPTLPASNITGGGASDPSNGGERVAKQTMRDMVEDLKVTETVVAKTKVSPTSFYTQRDTHDRIL